MKIVPTKKALIMVQPDKVNPAAKKTIGSPTVSDKIEISQSGRSRLEAGTQAAEPARSSDYAVYSPDLNQIHTVEASVASPAAGKLDIVRQRIASGYYDQTQIKEKLAEILSKKLDLLG